MASGRRRKRFGIQLGIATIVAELIVLHLRGWGFGGRVVVRCREGHLFTTIWIPAASLKSVRLGWWRFQRCPVGGHWSFVTPANRAELSRRERRRAGRAADVRLP